MPNEDGQAGEEQGQAHDAQGQQEGGAAKEEQVDLESLQSEISNMRDARKKLDGKLKEYQTELAELRKFRDAGKSAAERLQSENETLKAQLAELTGKVRESTARDAVFAQSRKLGSPKPDLVWRLVRADLEFDDDGGVSNLDAVMKDVKAIAPELFRPAGNADSGAGAGASNGSSDWLRREFEKARR